MALSWHRRSLTSKEIPKMTPYSFTCGSRQADMEAVLPSNLTYKERLNLRASDSYQYNQLYSRSSTSNVVGRLMSDASGRQQRRAIPRHAHPTTSLTTTGSLSGFVSNTSPAVYTHDTFHTGHRQFGEVPISTMGQTQFKRYKQKNPIDYLTQIRPDTETMNQTMRMLGTYKSDYAAAAQSGAFIPSGCPGGQPWYHPDVVMTRRADTIAAGCGTTRAQLTRQTACNRSYR